MNKITNAEVMLAAEMLWDKLKSLSDAPITVWGIPRGGVSAAYALVAASGGAAEVAITPSLANIIVDDLFDSGATMRIYAEEFPEAIRGVLFTKAPAQTADAGCYYGKAKAAHEWLVFPWEDSVQGSADGIVTRLLQFIGEDPQRPGLVETPARVIKAWQEWCAGYAQDPAAVLKTFADGAERVDEMVVVRDIPIYSHCEHHLAPFFGVAHISYIPNGRIVGLSKLVRLADIFARRLQVQERLTNQIADALVEHLAPKGVGVVIECRHLCMESRGVRKAGATTVTSAMRGALLTKPEARAELMSLVRR